MDPRVGNAQLAGNLRDRLPAGLRKRLCCKKSQINTMDVLLPFLLRLSRHSKQASDERYLACDVSFVYPLHLAFPHDVHHFIALERPPRCL